VLPTTSPAGQAAAARGNAVIAAFAPSVAPWASARVGVAGSNEAGLTYTGRAARLDFRHAFENDRIALSVGAGASMMMAGSDRDGAAPGTEIDLDLGSVGADVPVLFGWRSDAGIVTFWIGPRGGFERLTGSATVTPGNASGSLDLWHWYAGTVVGLALGFRHVHGAFELDTSYQSLHGTVVGSDVHVTGVTVTPAAAMLVNF
jgi:hypothetical protein